MPASNEAPKKVLILGGGPAGAFVAKALDQDKNFDVTLVDTKAFLEFVPSTPMLVVRAFRDEDSVRKAAGKVLVPHATYVKNGRVVLGRAASVSRDMREVTLENGARLSCDYLVLATGTTYAAPWKVQPDEPLASADEYMERLAGHREQASGARHVLVVGGGATGVEVAAEFVESHPETRVTLVTSAATLLAVKGVSSKLGQRAADFFRRAGDRVDLVLGERAEAQDDGSYRLNKSGRVIRPDLAYVCVGAARPNTGFLRGDGGLAAALDERGYVRVRDTMQVDCDGADHVLALGDVAATGQSKMTKCAIEHGKHAATLLKAAAKGKQKLPTLPAETPGFVVSLGKRGAVGDLGLLTLTGWTAGGSGPAACLKGAMPGMVTGKLK